MSVRRFPHHPIIVATVGVAALVATCAPVARAQDTPTPVQTCAATNVGGFAYEGFVCGGSVADNCTPGAIYQCQGGGVLDPRNNCALAQACDTGCLTGTTSTPLTVNTQFPRAADACFVGSRPLTLSTSDTLGGTDVTVTATLSESQNTANGPILNLRGGGVLVPHPFCAVPFRLAPGATTSPASVTFGLPTAVVDAPAVANLNALISYTDRSGFNRALVSIPWTIRLQPGGTEPPAPPVKSLTVGPSTIGPGQLAVVDVELAKFAPARGIRVSLSSSDPAVASILENGQPFVMGGCTTGGGAANVRAADFVDKTTNVTISGTSGAPNEVAATDIITVGETALDLSRVSLNPTAVLAGTAATGTLTMTRPAPAGGAEVVVTSSSPSARVPSSVIVPAGASSATFPITTPSDASTFASATIGGSFEGDFDASAQLVVWPAGTTQAVSALTLNPVSVVGPESSTGTVAMRYAPPSAPAQVALSSSNTAAARVPAGVAVPAGSTSASFVVTTSEVTASSASTITAAFAGTTQDANITVTSASPPPASAVLSTYTVSPTTVNGGQSATGIVTLASAAPAAGVAVDLASQLPGTAAVPASVTVPPGATSASFTITTFPPSGTTSVSLTASLNGTFRFTALTVAAGPPSGGGASGFFSPSGQAADTGGDGNGFDANAANASGDDAAVAADMNSGSSTSTSCTNSGKDRHRFYDFAFGLPAGSTLAGIEVRLDARADSTSGTPRMCVQLSSDGGVTWTAAKSTPTLGTALNSFTLGGATDTWGRAWNATDLSDTSFRVRVINTASSTSRDFFLDWIALRPHAAAGGSSPTPQAATLSVSAAGRSGERITSTPLGINVPVGSTGSASFQTGTTITLTVSGGREAIWSGACSSAGTKRNTCVFTLNGAAAVTANVQ